MCVIAGDKVVRPWNEGIGQKVSMDGMQFGCMPKKGTTDAIVVVQQL